jgi:hypothetical protein
MRQSSLRALLLALTMVFQTIVAGVGVARAAPEGLRAGVSAHCSRIFAGAGDAADPHHERRRHNCDACNLCAGPPDVGFVDFVPLVLSPRGSRVAHFLSVSTSAAPSRLAGAQFARGPPRRL